ncbi:MAG: class I SAM-dependent methyltransferase [Gammaproteobacteria bacterium]|jgi:cyclopropane fatty-acyl-phospholipid synthase-like methyltransferase|nr:class I SAM-dependent methyltransferase [Gammaproteobacteria bacterium]
MGSDFYEDPANVENYSKFTPAHDGALLIDALRAELPAGATVLEIGMGPGKDLDLLAAHYTVTGSDLSHAFLERYRAQHPDADLLCLDARTLDTDRRFDAIFSNKALIHLSAAELEQSLARQHALLNANGLLLHSLWHGEGTKQFGELTLTYHNARDLRAMLEPAFDILALERHAKMADGDSIYVLARKR